MSDEGDRACPLCAEEMDLTDQQLKPCQCGYEICIWCWHQIMDLAEKDQTQGRCPACRTPYNKEKVVSTAANCERLVAEMNMEKKMKSQKAKSKISDGRKQLGSVRVIQKSLVYIVGLPLTLADENLLQNGDYFGKYGRVLKVSISRTAAGSIQQFANSTCSVYITYSKEEEAVRCIQSVHGFVLDDRPLKACFGTTKYCHAWLRNVPCSNPDCLYLHEVGTQEDSFAKDEMISEYTRNRVQLITGATSNMQLRSGNILPPPADECHISSSTLTGKPTSRSASNNVATGSLPNSSPGRSAALPSAASWGARACKGNPPPGNIACSNVPSKQKSGTYSGSLAFSTAVVATVQVPRLHAETRGKLNKPHKDEQEPVETSSKQDSCANSNTAHQPVEASSKQDSCANSNTAHQPAVYIHSSPSPKDNGRCDSTAPIETSMDLFGRSCNLGPANDLNVSAQGNYDNLCSRLDSMSITNLRGADHSRDNWQNSLISGKIANSSVNNGIQQCYDEEFREPPTSIPLGKTVAWTDDSRVPKEKPGMGTGFPARRQIDSQVESPRVRQHVLLLEGKKLNDSEVVTSTSYFSAPSCSLHHSTVSSVHSPTETEPCVSSSLIQDPLVLDNDVDNDLLLHPSGNSAVLNGYPGDIVKTYLDSDRNFERAKVVGTYEGEAANSQQSFATDVGESNMISNILSLDFDPWEESLTSPRNLVKLLGKSDKHQGTLAPSSSWKAETSNKSRFSFARPGEFGDLPTTVEPSFSHMQQVFKESPLQRDFALNRELNFDKLGDCNGFSSFNSEEPDNIAGNYSNLSSNKFSGSRFQISAPPGFSTPSKAPPPGFASHERMEPNFDAVSGNHFLDVSSFLKNPYESPQNGNTGSSTDIEFMDPAILAVGKGRLPMGLNNGVSWDMNSYYSPQLNAVENEFRFQSSMQRSSPPVQNMRFSGIGNGFGPMNDTHNHLPSRIMDQTLASNLSPFLQHSLQQPRTSMVSNGQWNSWIEGKNASEMAMGELLRTENLSFNNFYGGYEDSKFRMPSSGDIYNRTYGI